MKLIENLNHLGKATWQGTDEGTILSIEVPRTRRLRRACRSRRWEKKFCKGLSKLLGYQILHVGKWRKVKPL